MCLYIALAELHVRYGYGYGYDLGINGAKMLWNTTEARSL
jgi:hypothetical protein